MNVGRGSTEVPTCANQLDQALLVLPERSHEPMIIQGMLCAPDDQLVAVNSKIYLAFRKLLQQYRDVQTESSLTRGLRARARQRPISFVASS